ncbi:hypothetical protein [Pseudonocardia spinosispora]|uniref:hypothetical protein n=1 Tax=Pseudonocardia spinosispora TaxID=103441 RepID=UPI0012EC0C82|nr:hypothetical protein [Pseudonocardia spinosispora]
MNEIDADQLELDSLAASPTIQWCSLDMEFQYFVVRERLSRKLTEVRLGPPVVTRALLDGSARRRRDQRMAGRMARDTGAVTERAA